LTEIYRFLHEICLKPLHLFTLLVYLSEILVYLTVSTILLAIASVGSISKITRDSTSESRNEFTAVNYGFIPLRLYTFPFLRKQSRPIFQLTSSVREREQLRDRGESEGAENSSAKSPRWSYVRLSGKQ